MGLALFDDATNRYKPETISISLRTFGHRDFAAIFRMCMPTILNNINYIQYDIEISESG